MERPTLQKVTSTVVDDEAFANNPGISDLCPNGAVGRDDRAEIRE